MPRTRLASVNARGEDGKFEPFDPAQDVAGAIMAQTLPFIEPPFLAVYEKFERAVYTAG